MSYIDWSQAPKATSYAPEIQGIGDALALVMKRREQKRQFEEEQALKRDAENRQWAGQRDEAQYRAGELGIKQQHETREGRQYLDTKTHAALAAIHGHLANGDVASATAAAQEAGIPFTPQNDSLAPMAPEEPGAPVAPEAPPPVDRPPEPTLLGPMRNLPPEVRAILGRGQQAAAAVPERQPPPEALDAYVPQQFGRPEQPTQPGPAGGGDAVDQELAKSRAQELADYEAAEKARAASQASLRTFEAGSRGAHYQAAEEGARAQAGAEAAGADANSRFAGQQQDYTRAAEEFPAQQQQYRDELASLPARQREHDERTTYAANLPTGETVNLPSVHDLRYAPRQRDAADFRRAQVAPLQAALANAKTLPEVARLRSQIADAEGIARSIESGGEELGKSGNALQKQDLFGAKEGNLDQRLADTLANRTQNARIAASAAGARAQLSRPEAGEPDTKVEARYQADVGEVKKNSLAPADMKEIRTIDKLHADLMNPNGPQHQLAMDNITRMAVGGRAPVQLTQNLAASIGLYNSAENWMYRQTHGGVSMPKVLDMYRKAMNDTKAVSDNQRRADAEAFEEKAGIRSHWFQVPEMRARVLDNGRAYYRQLGLPLPPEYAQYGAAPAAGAPAPAAKGKAKTADPIEEFLNGP